MSKYAIYPMVYISRKYGIFDYLKYRIYINLFLVELQFSIKSKQSTSSTIVLMNDLNNFINESSDRG